MVAQWVVVLPHNSRVPSLILSLGYCLCGVSHMPRFSPGSPFSLHVCVNMCVRSTLHWTDTLHKGAMQKNTLHALEAIIIASPPSSMFLGSGRKLKNLEKTHMDTDL